MKNDTTSNTLVKSIRRITPVLILLLAFGLVRAQEVENETEYRSDLDLVYKLNKKLSANFTPGIRFDESLSIDKYQFEGSVTYKPLKFLSLEGSYRYVINPRNEKDTEYFNRYAFSAKAEKEFGRFNSGLRIKYANDADDETEDKEFLRYKFSLDYNIPKSKITPEISTEAFQQLGNDAGMHKMRYAAGVSYKLFKNNYIDISYKFDYYYTEYTNKHIIGLGYKIKF